MFASWRYLCPPPGQWSFSFLIYTSHCLGHINSTWPMETGLHHSDFTGSPGLSRGSQILEEVVSWSQNTRRQDWHSQGTPRSLWPSFSWWCQPGPCNCPFDGSFHINKFLKRYRLMEVQSSPRCWQGCCRIWKPHAHPHEECEQHLFLSIMQTVLLLSKLLFVIIKNKP